MPVGVTTLRPSRGASSSSSRIERSASRKVSLSSASMRDGDRPDVVARDRREVALGEAVVLAARLRGAAGVHVEHGQRHAPRGHGRELVGELAHRVLDLAQAALAHAQPEELGAGEDRDGRVLQAPAQLDALVDEHLGVVEVAGDHGPPRAVQRDVGAGARVARVGGDAVERLDRHVGAREVVELEQEVDLPRARADRRAPASPAASARAKSSWAQARPRSAVSGPLVAMWPWSRT